jgi:hypothetical protein
MGFSLLWAFLLWTKCPHFADNAYTAARAANSIRVAVEIVR